MGRIAPDFREVDRAVSYYVNEDNGPLMRYDPATRTPPVQIPGTIGIRAATRETSDGFVYTVSSSGDATLWRFNTRPRRLKPSATPPSALRIT